MNVASLPQVEMMRAIECHRCPRCSGLTSAAHCLAERLSAADVEPSKYRSWTRIELFGKRVTGDSLPRTGGHHAPTKSKC
jgi:hypothetical protein